MILHTEAYGRSTMRPATQQVRRAHGVRVPSTPLLARALPRVDWSDAYAVPVPPGRQGHPQEWADAIFHSPPLWIRLLFGVREVLVRAVGIERGGSHVFDTVASRDGEVLLGTDQGHLGFRASVLVEPRRVVLSTVVQVHNRRGRAYSALVRRVHPVVVRGMLARAARKLTVSA
jgi:hypothetical protein